MKTIMCQMAPMANAIAGLDIAELWDRLSKAEGELVSHRRALVYLLKGHGARTVLLSELHRASNADWFHCGEVFSGADKDLKTALDRCSIQSARGLSQWLTSIEGFGVERGGRDMFGFRFRVHIPADSE